MSPECPRFRANSLAIRDRILYEPARISWNTAERRVKYKTLIGALVGIVITPVAVILSLKSAQRGDFYWAGMFYPVLTLMLLKGAGPLVVPLALLQYPFFGWYTGRCINNERYIRLAALLLLAQVFPMLLAIFN